MTDKPLSHLPANAYLLIDEMDTAFGRLIASAPPNAKQLSFALYQAALSVAVQGSEEAVSKDLAKRALIWRSGKIRSSRNEKDRFWTAHAIKHSAKPKTRDTRGPGEETAFEEVARTMGISRITAEKRRYRKPKR